MLFYVVELCLTYLLDIFFHGYLMILSNFDLKHFLIFEYPFVCVMYTYINTLFGRREMLKREISKREIIEKLAFSLVWHTHEREKRDKYEVGPTCFFFYPKHRKAREVAHFGIFTFLPFNLWCSATVRLCCCYYIIMWLFFGSFN